MTSLTAGWLGIRRLILVTALATGLFISSAASGATATPSTPRGVVTGQLGYEGGAYPGLFHPTAGVVKFEGPQSPQRVKVPESGDFTVDVVPGHYTLTGCGGTKNRQCGPSEQVIVRSRATTHVQVPWLLAP
jgi:hypothetical protein